MPTRDQLVTAINTLRGRTPINPIRDTELADMLESWLNYFDKNGEIYPESFANNITVDTYEEAEALFEGNVYKTITVKADIPNNEGEPSFYTYNPALPVGKQVACLGLDYNYNQ